MKKKEQWTQKSLNKAWEGREEHNRNDNRNRYREPHSTVETVKEQLKYTTQ